MNSISFNTRHIRRLTVLSVVILLFVVLARAGYYADVLPYTLSAVLMAIGCVIAALVFFGVMFALARPTLKPLHTAIFLAALPLLPPVAVGGIVLFQAITLPHLYDVSTDSTNPPALNQADLLRTAGDHNVAFQPGNADLILAAYPDIKPIYSQLAPERAFMAAWELTNRLGWNTFYQDTIGFTLEATHKPLWFGAKEDIAVRVQLQKDGRTRIDVRSSSRQGVTDLGANAQNIREFIAGYPAAEKDVIAFLSSNRNSAQAAPTP